jgi:hypothetical protein
MEPVVEKFIDGLKLYLSPEMVSMIEQEAGSERVEKAKWAFALLDRFLKSETDAVIARGDAAVPDLEAALYQYENENELIALAIFGVLLRIREGEPPTG